MCRCEIGWIGDYCTQMVCPDGYCKNEGINITNKENVW